MMERLLVDRPSVWQRVERQGETARATDGTGSLRKPDGAAGGVSFLVLQYILSALSAAVLPRVGRNTVERMRFNLWTAAT